MKEDIEEELINCNNHSIINITGTSTIEEDINIEENIIIEEIFIADEEEKTIVYRFAIFHFSDLSKFSRIL